MLTARSDKGAKASETESLVRLLPAAIFACGIPLKVSSLGVDFSVPACSATAMLTPSTLRVSVPNTLLSRIRTARPPVDTCTISRIVSGAVPIPSVVNSIRGAADQVPVQPLEPPD